MTEAFPPRVLQPINVVVTPAALLKMLALLVIKVQ